jgi:uncharacterized phage protein gp47/JayE
MTDVLDFTPIFNETLARIRARMDADANAGLTVDDAAWVDTREGTFYWDMTQVPALEFARLWDALGSETVAAAFPSTAWGEYLDNHAETFGLVRNAATPATGDVLFAGAPNTLIAQGTQVSAPPSDPSLDAIVFATTASGTTSAGLAPPAAPGAVQGSPGSLAAGSYIYHVTAYSDFGETLIGADAAVTVSSGGSKVTVSWTAVAGATGYRVYRATAVGVSGQQIGDIPFGTNNFVDDGTATPGAFEPTANTSAGVILPIIATQGGTDTNLSIGAITELETFVSGITLVSNPDPTIDGTDPEDDEALRLRILAEYAGQGSGTTADYVRWTTAVPGVQRAACIPEWDGPGTVLVIPMVADGSAVSADVVIAVQNLLDPTPGLADGKAPIGASVTVETTTGLTIHIAAAVSFKPGYSLDGTSGTIATRAEIVAALNEFLNVLNPGDWIRYQQVQAQILNIDGVIAVTGLTVNSGTADIELSVTPPQNAELATPTLT